MSAHHDAFLASQTVHPIIEQIQTIAQQYGAADGAVQPIVLRDDAGTSGQQQADLGEELGRLTQDGVNESISTEVFSSYKHREVLPGCLPHPGDIVEAGPLSAIVPPATDYPLAKSLPREIIEEGKLSSLQLEGVIQASQRHQMILPNGQRAGFFIGDAAGVGKGRQIAGVILDNFVRGRTKSIWFTISADLIVDTRRDIADLGCHIKVIDGCQELDKHTRVLGLPADFKEGVVFSTYATLVSTVQRGGAFTGSRQSRLQQLVSWCGGENFDGCLIFDECHKAKNFVPGKEHASTKVAMAVTNIQRMLPKARVLYCSATGVSDVKNMAFMERLGLWGDGAPYRNFEHFLVSIQRKGLGMAEMLAMEMKSAGMYVSRGLSYKQAEFITIEANLTADQIKMYNMAVHVWTELRKAMESAMARTVNTTQRVWQQFWSCHQRFFKQLCLGMKVPTIVKEAQEALNTGHCIVIGLQTTGEASMDSEMGQSTGGVTGFMSQCREMLTRFITQQFPTRVSSVKEGEIQEDQWCVTAKNMLLGFAKQIALPDNPLDEIIDKLGGPAMVAEMTGRKGRIVRRSPKDKPQYETRTPDSDAYGAIDSLNVQERNMFMEGKKFVAIISDAASTGISLHADLRAGNQRRRVHLTVELPWSADKAVQQLGRSHRSNQSSGPLYKLLTTDLGGERRFAAAVARRLQSLGALTKGDRRAATGADLNEFNFDTPYGRTALRTMYHHICQKKLVPGLSLASLTRDRYDLDTFSGHMLDCLLVMGLIDENQLRLAPVLKEKDTADVSKFLNRILGVTVEKQNMMFNYFTECMKLGIQYAKKEGRYNEGMLDITASSVEMVGQPREIFKDLNRSHTATRLVELNVDRGMSWEQAVTRADNHTGKNDGFYQSKRDVWGRKLYLLATQKEDSNHLFRIARPNTGLSLFEEEKTDLMYRYTPIKRDDAAKAWKTQYETTKTSCVHGSHCKNKDFCKVGSRCYRLHLLCGSIVSMMNVLETTLNRNAVKLNLSKTESTVRVVRVRLNDGERVVGIRYPEILIPHVEVALKEMRMAETAQQSTTQTQLAAGVNVSQSASIAAASSILPSSQASSSPTISSTPSSSQSSVDVGISQSAAPLPSTLLLSQTEINGDISQDTGHLPNSANIDSGGAVMKSTDSVTVVVNGNESGSSSSGKCESQASTQSSSQAVNTTGAHVPVQGASVSSVTRRGLKAVIEGVAEVKSKCLKKAMTPPITIKNFFKPVCKSSGDGKSAVEKSSGDVKSAVVSTEDENSSDSNASGEGSKSTDKKVNGHLKEMSYADFLKNQTGDKITDVGLSPVTDSTNNAKGGKYAGKENGCVSDKDKDAKVTVDHSNSPKPSLSRKRTGDDSPQTPSSKKVKQASIFSSFKKMSAKKEEVETKAVTCPICCKIFEKNISNVDLNNHIDNCIIE